MTGDEFKRLRLSKGFKKRPQLAAYLECSTEAIKKWETGLRRVNPIAIALLNKHEELK